MVIISDPVSFLAAHSVSYLAAHHCNPPAQLSARLVNWFFDLFPFSCSPRPCFFLTAHHFLLGWSVHSPVGDSNPVECSKRWSQSTSTWAALPAEYFPSFFVSFFLSFQPTAQLINDQVEKLRVLPPILSENFSPLKYVNIWERLSFENSTNNCRTFLAPFFIGPRYT